MSAEKVRSFVRAFELPLEEIHFSYARSSGPGGQNVNKVNSKTVLYWNIQNSKALNEGQKQRILAHLETRINHEGELVLMSDRYRDQPQKRDDCLEKALDMITPYLVPPRERRKTKPSRSSIRKGKQGKKLLSEKKQSRMKFRD